MTCRPTIQVNKIKERKIGGKYSMQLVNVRSNGKSVPDTY